MIDLDVLRAAACARDGQSLLDAIDEMRSELNNTRHYLEQSEQLRREALAERDAARAELGLVVSASLLLEGEELVEPPGPRGAAVAAMLNTVHRAHTAETNAPLCECGRLATCIGRSEAGIECCCDDCCGHGQEDRVCVPISGVARWVTEEEKSMLESMDHEVAIVSAECDALRADAERWRALGASSSCSHECPVLRPERVSDRVEEGQ